MRVPDEWLNAVFFLAIDRPDGQGGVRTDYVGTGFYLGVPNETDPKLRRLYFVTARHVIEGSQTEDGQLHVRVNTEDGGVALSPITKVDWVFHPDPSVDVAVLSPAFQTEGAPALQYTYIEEASCATPEVIESHHIGIGSDLTAVGLFTSRRGVARNIPVVRSGIIAAMPGEPIDDRADLARGPVRAYLAEILSMGGLSGSPVFVHPVAGPQHVHPKERIGDRRVRETTVWNEAAFVLGMIRSHWDEPPPDRFGQVPRREWINRGIAVVTPISGVLDVINSRELADQRKQDAKRETRSSSGTLD